MERTGKGGKGGLGEKGRRPVGGCLRACFWLNGIAGSASAVQRRRGDWMMVLGCWCEILLGGKRRRER